MRKLFSSFLAALLIFSSCRKDAGTPPVSLIEKTLLFYGSGRQKSTAFTFSKSLLSLYGISEISSVSLSFLITRENETVKTPNLFVLSGKESDPLSFQKAAKSNSYSDFTVNCFSADPLFESDSAAISSFAAVPGFSKRIFPFCFPM